MISHIPSHLIIYVTLLSFSAQTSQDVTQKEGADEQQPTLAITADSAEGIVHWKEHRKQPVHWNGNDLDPGVAVPILMSVIEDRTAHTEVRMKALDEMMTLANGISGTQWIVEMIALYSSEPIRDIKVRLLDCIVSSGDPQAFTILDRVLREERTDAIRYKAAYGLAQWNVRRGVHAFIDLFSSKELLPEPIRAKSRTPYLRDSALEFFSILNHQKGWGFSTKDIQKAIEARGDLSLDEMQVLYIAEIRKWFAENEHRFPEWKPGDPLPEMPDPETDKSDK